MISSKLKSNLKTSRRIKVLIVLLTILVITFFIPKGESIESEVKVGEIWVQDDLIASKTFEVLKDPVQYENEKKNAELKILPVFLRNTSLEKLMIDSLSNYNKILLENIYSNSIINKTNLSDKSFQIFLKLKSKKNNIIKLLDLSKIILKDIYDKGILDVTRKEIKKDSIQLRLKNIQRAVPIDNFIEYDKINEYLIYKIRAEVISDTEIENALKEYISLFIKPNIVFSLGLTEDYKNLAKQKIPRNIGIINENERIIAKHDRITPEAKLKIDSYRIAKGDERTFFVDLLQIIGIYLHLLLLVLPFIIYIYLFRKKIFEDNLKITLIAINFILISYLTFLINSIKTSLPIEYLIFVPVSSMLLTILFDSRVGFYSNVVLSLIVGALRGNDYTFAATNIITGGLAAYTVRDIKNRTQIFRSFLYIFIGYALSIMAFGFERYQSISEIIYSLAFSSTNALLSPVITYGLIIFFEKIFNTTTDLTLLELTDLNSPLLKDLAKNAPGTFSHSIAMGTLVETTAEAIGANPILARVGAYYHDIGKMIEPGIFVENQIDTHNIHENISPEKSRDIIVAHVEKGIELGQKYKLPNEIIDFIPMHHGTMVLTYFYEKAKNLYGETNVNIDEYRYPGPKPKTKETALVMLADACESTIRSIEETDTQVIENVINNLINSRIEDGQLDESPLTFNDIKKIKESFFNILIGLHHRRIRYPNQDEMETKGEEKL
ncbi:MAG: HDIG domain-containing metalloprotein [Stygiobacter sp.]|jgi:putative nucleotidyltransferase with HDIG domain|uniref:HDIG domain-containing protein n=1 Tax=Stygiobacter electus TaxID=3032292 RepID=A0AAE3NXV6_9BACT|nr:HDIG domain-containing metalloprotein [Stygiobacter electus]MDF1610784.1 HDIG domain-containing protein [Stygiobacter electus]